MCLIFSREGDKRFSREDIWVWLKIKQEWLRRFWSMFPLARVDVGTGIFEPQPYVSHIFQENNNNNNWKQRTVFGARQASGIFFVRAARSTRSSCRRPPAGARGLRPLPAAPGPRRLLHGGAAAARLRQRGGARHLGGGGGGWEGGKSVLPQS